MAGLKANWTLHPPSMLRARMTFSAAVLRRWWSVSERVRQGAQTLAGVDSHGVEVLHVTDDDAVVVGVPHDLVLVLLPSEDGLLDEDLVDP